MEQFYIFVKDIVTSDYGMSVRDVMATDWHDLMAILSTDNAKTMDDEVIPLEKFIGSLSL